MSADVLSWQTIATTLTHRSRIAARSQKPRGPHRGQRRISQETVKLIRIDSFALTRAEVAVKYGVSQHYVYLVVDCGLRDDEREKLRA
jgi:hypothetical protein